MRIKSSLIQRINLEIKPLCSLQWICGWSRMGCEETNYSINDQTRKDLFRHVLCQGCSLTYGSQLPSPSFLMTLVSNISSKSKLTILCKIWMNFTPFRRIRLVASNVAFPSSEVVPKVPLMPPGLLIKLFTGILTPLSSNLHLLWSLPEVLAKSPKQLYPKMHPSCSIQGKIESKAPWTAYSVMLMPLMTPFSMPSSSLPPTKLNPHNNHGSHQTNL